MVFWIRGRVLQRKWCLTLFILCGTRKSPRKTLEPRQLLSPVVTVRHGFGVAVNRRGSGLTMQYANAKPDPVASN